MGDVVVVLAGAGAADAELLVDPRDVVGVVDGGAATDDGSPLVQLCGVCTAAKTSAEITATMPTINAINGRSHRCASACCVDRSCESLAILGW